LADVSFSIKMDEFKDATRLASEIIESGSRLDELLIEEPEVKVYVVLISFIQ